MTWSTKTFERCVGHTSRQDPKSVFQNPEVWPDLALYVARSRICLNPSSFSSSLQPKDGSQASSEPLRSLASSLGSGRNRPQAVSWPQAYCLTFQQKIPGWYTAKAGDLHTPLLNQNHLGMLSSPLLRRNRLFSQTSLTLSK